MKLVLAVLVLSALVIASYALVSRSGVEYQVKSTEYSKMSGVAKSKRGDQGQKRDVQGCGWNSYSYSGIMASSASAHGVAATITVGDKNPKKVRSEQAHSAAYVGIAGITYVPLAGHEPQKRLFWIQVGWATDGFILSTGVNATGTCAYVEHNLPGPRATTKYARNCFKNNAHPGDWMTFQVIEHKRDYYQAYANGTKIGPTVHLPGSHKAHWSYQATSENNNGDNTGCQPFAYEFTNVKLAKKPGQWSSFSPFTKRVDAGLHFNAISGGFAVAG